MISKEASDIGKEILNLKKFGAIVKNYNSNRRYSKSQSAWVDHLIIYDDRMYLIEVKIGDDFLSPDQLELAIRLLGFNEVNYFVLTSLAEARELVEILLDKDTTEHELWRFRDRTEKIIDKQSKKG